MVVRRKPRGKSLLLATVGLASATFMNASCYSGNAVAPPPCSRAAPNELEYCWEDRDLTGDAPDGGADAGTDTASDAGADTATDAGTDTAPDAGTDTAPDAAADAGTDTALDAGTDTAPDAAADAPADMTGG
jgi:hypothetical protein